MEGMRPEGVEEWFQIPGLVWSDEGWEVAMARPLTKLSHRSCPWGGHLIRFSVKHLVINNAPEKTGNVLVRPEVRAAYHDRIPLTGTRMCLEKVVQPGEAVLRGLTSTKLMRLCVVLFGEMSGRKTCCFHDAQSPVSMHQKIRRDYPCEGDSALAFWQEDRAHEGLFALRPMEKSLAKTFDLSAVLRLPEDKFASWATFQFRTLLTVAHKTVEWMFNRPGVERLRALDQIFYVILQIQSFGRGFPLIPSGESDAIVTIDAGAKLGYPHWKRFESDKFRMPEYIKCFLGIMGLEVDTYDHLDSRKLVPYQCVMRRSDWEMAKPRFLEVFRLAKTAYRRCNGGTVAPGIQEAEAARKIPDVELGQEDVRHRTGRADPWVIRKTFLDVHEGPENGGRPERRPRTTKF